MQKASINAFTYVSPSPCAHRGHAACVADNVAKGVELPRGARAGRISDADRRGERKQARHRTRKVQRSGHSSWTQRAQSGGEFRKFDRCHGGVSAPGRSARARAAPRSRATTSEAPTFHCTRSPACAHPLRLYYGPPRPTLDLTARSNTTTDATARDLDTPNWMSPAQTTGSTRRSSSTTRRTRRSSVSSRSPSSSPRMACAR